MEDTHTQLIEQFHRYIADNYKFAEKENKAAGTRSRKALANLMKLAKQRRSEIQSSRTS